MIVGGGYGGLAAAYELALAGKKPVVFEAEKYLGGLAGSFDADGVRLEKFYHHWFNSDTANKAGQGAGTNMLYVESNEGKLVATKGVKARYVRIYSCGNNVNELNHFIEVEVFGLPAK